MKKMTIGEAKSNFAEVLDRAQKGETILITEGRQRKLKAQIGPISIDNKERKIGILEGKAQFIFKKNFKMTLDEFLGK